MARPKKTPKQKPLRKISTQSLKNLVRHGSNPLYGKKKDQRIGISLTPTALKGLKAIALEKDVSVSELIERIGRKIYKLE